MPVKFKAQKMDKKNKGLADVSKKQMGDFAKAQEKNLPRKKRK